MLKKVTTAKSVSKKGCYKKPVTSNKSLKTEKNNSKKRLLKLIQLIFLQKKMRIFSFLITKEFDKELTKKSETYIKSYAKIEDSIITVSDFLKYIENLDEDLLNYLKLTQVPLIMTRFPRVMTLKKKNLQV